MMSSRALATLALAALLAACADKDTQPPAELTEFRSTADIERVWSASLSGNQPRLRLGLGLAAAGDNVYAASYSGDVVAMNGANGRRLWRTGTGLKLSGGPGVGDNLVVVGATHGDLVALDATTGEEKWRTRINTEILSAPAIASGTVLLRTVDGRFVALRATDGSQIWSAEEEVPRLSLRGTARPLASGELALAGFDNGRVLALQLTTGDTVWEQTVSPPTGRSELERLVDIDTAIEASGNDVFVVTYQGKAARLDRETGVPVWTRDVSSHSGLALDDTGLYISTAEGAVVKLDRTTTGVELWRQSALTRRRLSPPALLGSLVVVADLQGYVHFLDKETGALAARVHPFTQRVLTPPVVSGDRLVLMDSSGKIAALRIRAEGEAASGATVRGGSAAGGGAISNDTPTGFPTRQRPGN